MAGSTPPASGRRRRILAETYRSWRAHRTIRLGAALAYYGLFALPPLFTVGVAGAGLILDEDDIRSTLDEVLSDIGDGSASDLSASISAQVAEGITITSLGLIGLGALLISGSLLFVALQDALDTVWDVPVGAGAGYSMRRRLVAFAVVLLSGAVLVAAFIVQTLARLVREFAPGEFMAIEVTADVLAATGSAAIVAAVVALLFRYLTSADVPWRAALLGGALTAAALTVGNRLVAEYLSRFGSSSLAGATGSVLVGLFWIYSIAQIVLAGAVLTRTVAESGHG